MLKKLARNSTIRKRVAVAGRSLFIDEIGIRREENEHERDADKV